MKVQELTHDQLTQIKSQMVIIPNGEAFAYYDGTEYSGTAEDAA